MEGRFNNQLNTDNRRARSELTNQVEGLAQQILDHIASNPQPAPPAGRGHPQPVHRAVRGRAPSRSFPGPSSRSVSFSSVCGCPGVGCTSGAGAEAADRGTEALGGAGVVGCGEEVRVGGEGTLLTLSLASP